MKYIFHIGTNEGLAFAEVGNVFGYESVLAVYKNYMLVETDQELNQKFLNRMGSLISIYKVVETVTPINDQNLSEFVAAYFEGLSFDSKMCYAVESNFLLAKDTEQLLKNIKKNLKNSEIGSRFILNVNAAALKDAGTLGVKLFVFGFFAFKNLEQKFACELVAIQDIDGYSSRDYGKPYRSAKLGMLPPKLSQIMINISTGSHVYDPFCGTGTVLIESILMGKKAQGSDIQDKNIVGTKENLVWLKEQNAGLEVESKVFELDAKKIESSHLENVDAIVTEGFLGVPKQGKETNESLVKELEDLGDLYFAFLQAVSKASRKADLSLVIVLPVYKGTGSQAGKNYFIENLVEKLPALGYSTSALVPVNTVGLKAKDTVLYKRSDQKVFRQIIKLELKAN